MSQQKLNPAKDPHSSTGEGASGPGESRQQGGQKGLGPSRRTRNTPKDVTANACMQCKKARTKCDGNQPCYRCLQRGEGAMCEYRVHVKMAKEQLIAMFSQQQKQYRWAHQVMQALISDNYAPGIVDRLKKGEDYGSVARSFDNLSLKDVPRPSLGPSPSSPSGKGKRTLTENMDYEVEGAPDKVYQSDSEDIVLAWTQVVPDPDSVQHLLELYFTWVHPVHMVLSEPHFRNSFNRLDRAYCSSALVNTMCAMACHLLDPYGEEEGYEALQEENLGERFMEEARAVIKPEDHNRLTTVQAFAIMFLVDAGAGRALKASAYIKFASASLLETRIQRDVQRDAWQITLWGVYSLNIAWTEFTFENVEMQHLSNETIFDGVHLDRGGGSWRPYRFLEDRQGSTQPGQTMVTAFETAKLLQIVRDTISLYHDNRTAEVKAGDILKQLKRYNAWRENLPEEISSVLSEEDSAVTPHVYFLHVHYHTAVVNLICPLVGGIHFPRRGQSDPEVIALHHAQQGLLLLEKYRRAYTSRYQCQMQMLCLLQLSDFIVRFGSPLQSKEASRFCLNSLRESRSGYNVCGPLQEMFCRVLVECGVELPEDVDELMHPRSDFCLDEILEACTRLSYTQPVDVIRRRFTRSIAEDWHREWQKINDEASSSSSGTSSRRRREDDDKLMQIRSILNG